MDDEGSDRFRYTKPYREVAAYLNTVKLLCEKSVIAALPKCVDEYTALLQPFGQP